jgi:hypothetical protein
MCPLIPPDLPNFLTEPNARKLAKRIERYWAERGYDCKTEIVDHISDEATRPPPHERHTIYCVRSNIGPDGFPPRAIEEEQAA